MSKQRNSYHAVAPVMNALYAPGKVLSQSGLEPALIDLVNMRASQINGCAFCLHLHALEAEMHGIERKRIDVLPAWREAGDWFSPRERAALEWTEAVTLVVESQVPDEVYARVAEQFTPEELTYLTLAVTGINAWNRFNVAFRTSPEGAEALFRQTYHVKA